MSIEVVAFDLFGTVFDLSGVSMFELRDYAQHIKKPEWSPIEFPKSWESLPAHPDAKEGLDKLNKIVETATFSNCPIDLQTKLLTNHDLWFDNLIDLSSIKTFKPNPKAYEFLATFYAADDIPADRILVVSANEHFGDIEGARAAGMRSCLIRHGYPNNILELAESLANGSFKVNESRIIL